MSKWSDFAPKPEPLPSGKSWHVFLSYRSVHRPWVLQLYDSLREVGFSVYLDQFVLRASDNLVQALQRGLDESAAAILVWSAESEESRSGARRSTTALRVARRGEVSDMAW